MWGGGCRTETIFFSALNINTSCFKPKLKGDVYVEKVTGKKTRVLL